MKRMKSIRYNMLVYAVGIIFLMVVLSFFALNVTSQYKAQIDGMFSKIVYLSKIKDDVASVDSNLIEFLSSKNSTKLNEYMIFSDELRTLISERDFQLTYLEEDLLLKDILNMSIAYIDIADHAIKAKRERNVNAYTSLYEESAKVKGYIFEYINELNTRNFNTKYADYLVMEENMNRVQYLTVALILDLLLLSVVIAYLMSAKMIKPITKLSYCAEEISKGRFDTSDILVDSDDELKIMADAFNKMKNSIRTYIGELTEKAETEVKLKDQQMANMKMQHLLDNAKLYALQSQINPHFLFNTINAGVQLAMLEGADRTSEFLESMSRLFRYNIKKMDSEVTLNEEVDNIRDYYELLKVRFGELIQFRFEIDEAALNLVMPPLILQPLVENAYIHGLSSKEEGGTISISAFREATGVYISIQDTGIGITKEKIHQILTSKERIAKNADKITQTATEKYQKGSGIGVMNVINRLELFYHHQCQIKIDSEVGQWTTIQIQIPSEVAAYV